VTITGEKGAVWLGVVSQTTHAHIFLDWLDEAMDGSYHLTADPPLSPTIPYCVQMFHWISTTR